MRVEKLNPGKKSTIIHDGPFPWNNMIEPEKHRPKNPQRNPTPDELKSAYPEMHTQEDLIEITFALDSYRITFENDDILDRLKSVIGITEHFRCTKTGENNRNEKILENVSELYNTLKSNKASGKGSLIDSYECFIETLRKTINEIIKESAEDTKEYAENMKVHL